MSQATANCGVSDLFRYPDLAREVSNARWPQCGHACFPAIWRPCSLSFFGVTLESVSASIVKDARYASSHSHTDDKYRPHRGHTESGQEIVALM